MEVKYNYKALAFACEPTVYLHMIFSVHAFICIQYTGTYTVVTIQIFLMLFYIINVHHVDGEEGDETTKD